MDNEEHTQNQNVEENSTQKISKRQLQKRENWHIKYQIDLSQKDYPDILDVRGVAKMLAMPRKRIMQLVEANKIPYVDLRINPETRRHESQLRFVKKQILEKFENLY